jgi:phosphate transport system substrate-binding protein
VKPKFGRALKLAAALSATALISGCAVSSEIPPELEGLLPELAETQLVGTITGAGATFPNPVFQEYQFVYSGWRQQRVIVNYQSIGSGGGIEQFLLQNIDFGSSERYLDDEALALARANRGCDAIQVPVLFGAVTIAFGDPQFDGLNLTAEVIADIFQRKIVNYSDPRLQALNPDRVLPDLDIIPVHRSDGSGTTSVFTTYLEWAVGDGSNGRGAESRFGSGSEGNNWRLGSGTEVQWPSGTIGGQGNEGVTAGIKQNVGGLGYVNQAYALANGLPMAKIRNSDGNFVSATIPATIEAIATVDIPDSFQFDILGVGGNGFPIAGTNWVFVWKCGYDEDTAAILKDYLTWTTTSEEAKNLAARLGYATLSDNLKARVARALEQINVE